MEQSEIIRIAAETAARTAISEYKKEREKAVRINKDKRLRNTKLLMKNYRSLKAHVQNAVCDIGDADENAVDILELMWDTGKSEAVVESIKRSALRTYIIINHIDAMLAAYYKMCQRSEVAQRRWEILKRKYIDDNPMKNSEIAEIYFINPRTVQKDIDCACSQLSTLIFGIDRVE
ncbi:MAG: hypothetical protein Q4G33_04505 [bacterium]|nr:hypothetical protein [bacterium]